MKKNIAKIHFLLVAAVALIANSCATDEATVESTLLTAVTVSSGDLYPAFNPETKDYFITSLNTLHPIEVTLNDFTPSKNIYINNQKVSQKITSLQLSPGDDIVIQSGGNQDNSVTYTIHYLPGDMPKANVITKNNPAEGLTLITMFELASTGPKDYSYIAILNNDGFPVYYKKLPYKSVINFRYFETGDSQKRFTYNINETGKAIIMNEKFEIIREVAILPHNGHGNYPIDNHDFIYLDDNHYIIAGMFTRDNVDLTSFGGANAVDLVEFVFQEIVNNEVVFEWNSADYPELISAADPIYQSQFSTNPKVDYFHFNSLAIDPNDHNFIVSARHTNQVYKINRITGAIMWRFGGNSDDFNLTGNAVISHQHCASILNNGHLLLFDNGVTKNPQQTRLAEFAINETTMSANLVYEYQETGRFSDIMGSAQKLDNGNYFIGWGGNVTSQINANKSDITEIDSAGNIVLDISFSNSPNRFTYSYRALKYNIAF